MLTPCGWSNAGRKPSASQTLTKSANSINPFPRQPSVSGRQPPKRKSFKTESSSPPDPYSNPPAESKPGTSRRTQAFRTGQIVIQDEASQLIAALVGTGSRILDCCAAPGGKTFAIADRNPTSSITAVELHPHRARLLQKMLPEQSPNSAARIQVITADAQHLPLTLPFDRVLADVPCSGTGTLARNPEIKWRLNPTDLADLNQRQSAILRSALTQVSPGGRLIYSTCSLEKEENENVVEQALAENKSFRLLDCRTELDRLKSAGELVWPDPATLTSGPYLRTIPGVHPCDGFFAAILERI